MISLLFLFLFRLVQNWSFCGCTLCLTVCCSCYTSRWVGIESHAAALLCLKQDYIFCLLQFFGGWFVHYYQKTKTEEHGKHDRFVVLFLWEWIIWSLTGPITMMQLNIKEVLKYLDFRQKRDKVNTTDPWNTSLSACDWNWCCLKVQKISNVSLGRHILMGKKYLINTFKLIIASLLIK